MMFEAWGYMLPQQNPTDLLILVNKTNKAPAVPVTLVKPNVQPTRESASENIYMRPEAAASVSASSGRSPIAIASPEMDSKPVAVTAQSATGTCHCPTI